MPTSNELYIQKNTRTSHKRWESMALYALHYALRDVEIISQYKVGLYFIDAYIPAANLAIEIDEEYHENNKTKDNQRQQFIENSLGCTFIRVDVQKNFYDQIDSIILFIENLNLPKWVHEPKISYDGEYSRVKNLKLETHGVYDFVDSFINCCKELGLNVSPLINSDAGNGMLGFRVYFDGLELLLISGVSKRIKFQVYDSDAATLTTAGLQLSGLLQGKYRNIIGYERSCTLQDAILLLTKIRDLVY